MVMNDEYKQLIEAPLDQYERRMLIYLAHRINTLEHHLTEEREGGKLDATEKG
jgi:hypothetical protein